MFHPKNARNRTEPKLPTPDGPITLASSPTIHERFSFKRFLPKKLKSATEPRVRLTPSNPAGAFIQGDHDPPTTSLRPWWDENQQRLRIDDQDTNDLSRTELHPFSPETDVAYQAAANAKEEFDTQVLQINSDTQDVDGNVDDLWEDVQRAITDAEARYESVPEIRKLLRKLGDKAPTIKHWMALLPNTAFSSSVCGGIQVLLEATEVTTEIRKMSLEFLAEIPDRISGIKTLDILYQNSPAGPELEDALHNESSGLYAAVLDSIHMIVRWLEINSGKKFGGAVAAGPTYAEDIRGKLKEIESRVTKVKDASDLCQKRIIVQMQREQKEGFTHLNSVVENSAMETVNKLMAYQEEKFELLSANLLLYFAAAAHGQTPSLRMGEELVRVLMPVECGPDPAVADLQQCYHDALAAGYRQKGRVNWTVKSARFGQWFQSPASETLIINGSDGDVSTRVSAMSYLCSLLIFSLASSKVSHAFFFCGKNLDPPRQPGARYMIRSLILQLIQQFPSTFDFHFLVGAPPTEYDLVDPDYLCWLFGQLLSQLGENMLFLIIDGVWCFETGASAEETSWIFKKLESIIREQNRLVVKLLITYPVRQMPWSLALEYEHMVLNIPPQVENEHIDTYTFLSPRPRRRDSIKAAVKQWWE